MFPLYLVLRLLAEFRILYLAFRFSPHGFHNTLNTPVVQQGRKTYKIMCIITEIHTAQRMIISVGEGEETELSMDKETLHRQRMSEQGLEGLTGASLVAQTVKYLPAMLKTWVRSLGWEDPLEKGKATPSSILAWRISWTEEPGRIQFMGSQSV